MTAKLFRQELIRQTHQLIGDKLHAIEPVQMDWAVQELILQQGTITGDGVPFYEWCAHETVYDVVKNAVHKYEMKRGPDEDNQLWLTGFEYLLQAYTIERNGGRWLVPIDLLSDEEIDARADELDRQTLGTAKHARELRQYKLERRKNRAA